MKIDALNWFRRLAKTVITVKVPSGRSFSIATGKETPTYITGSEWAYIGELTTEEVRSLAILGSLENSLLSKAKKVVSLNDHELNTLFTVGGTDYKILRKYRRAGLYFYEVKEK